MKFRVLWSTEARRELAQILGNAGMKVRFLLEAVRELERNLYSEALTFGDVRGGTLRIGFLKMLGVYFDVYRNGRTIIVQNLWRTDGH